MGLGELKELKFLKECLKTFGFLKQKLIVEYIKIDLARCLEQKIV